VDSVAILFKAYVNRTIQVYEEKGMTDDQVRVRLRSVLRMFVNKLGCHANCSLLFLLSALF